MKISRYNILTTVVVIAIAVSIPFLISGTTTTSQQQTNTPYNIFSPEVPTKINFAGKEIDVRRYDLRERLDRELTAFTYMHSTADDKTCQSLLPDSRADTKRKRCAR